MKIINYILLYLGGILVFILIPLIVLWEKISDMDYLDTVKRRYWELKDNFLQINKSIGKMKR